MKEKSDHQRFHKEFSTAKQQNIKVFEQLKKMKGIKQYPSQGLTNYAFNTDNVQK